jgi:hypothetical protein
VTCQGHQVFRPEVIKTRDAFPLKISTVPDSIFQTYSVDAIEDPECNEVRLEVSGLSLKCLKELPNLNKPESLPLGKSVSINPETYPESPEDVVVMLSSEKRGPSCAAAFIVASVALL